MQINLKENSKDKVCEFLDKEYVIDKNEFNFNDIDDFNIISDVFISGDIFVIDDLIKTDLNVFTKFEFICSRCLKNFIYDLSLKCNDEILLNDLCNEDIILDSDQNLTFTDYIKSYIITNIPQKKLCGSDCLGLCQCCGRNLNNEECGCQNNTFDNVFSRLKEVFVDSKEV